MSGTARVISNETDKSQRVSAISEIFVAGVIPSVRGASTPVLISNQNDFYRRYSPNNKYEAGYDLTYIEVEKFLEESSNLYLNRVFNKASYAGAVFYKKQSTKANASISIEIKNPQDYVMTTNNGRPLAGDSLVTIDADADKIQVDSLFYSLSKTGDKVRFTKQEQDTLPAEIALETDYYLVIDTTENLIRIADSKENALKNEFINISEGASGDTIKIENLETTFQLDQNEQPLVLFYAADQGDWANKISLKVINYETNKTLVREPEAFYLEVFYNGVTTGEIWLVSFDKNKKDKFGQSMYISNVLNRSNYIRAKVNPLAKANDIIKEATNIYIELAKGISDSFLTEADYIRALQPFRNKSLYKIQYISDFGITLPAVQKEIIDICQTRADCAAVLSVPLSAQMNSNYMKEILDYKNNVLNSVSTYAALYAGHVKVLERQTGREVWISPSPFVLSRISAQWNAGTPWEPVAGSRKGQLSVLDVYRHFDKRAEESILVDNGINPIRFDAGAGIKIWGNKTLQIKPTALENFHVRSLLTYIKKPIEIAVEPFLFELNDLDEAEGTRSTIKTIISLFLEDVKSRGGLYGYRVVVDSSNNSTQDVIEERLNIDIYISPSYGINEIHLNFTLTNSLIEATEAQ